MAKKAAPKPVAAHVPAVVVPTGPRVLLLSGYDADSRPVTSEASPDAPYTERDREIHVGGTVYTHVADAADGRWIYAPRDAKHR